MATNEFRINPYVEPSANGKSVIERFKSSFKGGLRPNKYKVEFSRNDGVGTPEIWQKLSTLCKGSVYSFYGYDKVEIFVNNTTQEYVNKINFEPVILRLYVDKKSDVLKTLYDLKELQYSDETGMFGFRDDYIIDITTTLLDENLENVTSVTYHNAMVINVDDIEVGWEAVDTLMEVSVTFAYDYPTYEFYNV